MPDFEPSPDVTAGPAAARSRRALLGAAVGGLAATVAHALGRPTPASAAAGSNLVIGSQANNAGTSDTQLITNSSVIAFKLLQQGQGTALMGHATATTGGTRGVYGRSDSPNGFGVQARSAGANGSGAALQAIGVNNTAVHATTDHPSTAAVHAVRTYGLGGGTGAAIIAEAASGTAIVANASGVALWATSTSGNAIYGSSAINSSYGVFGETSGSTGAAGVHGQASGSQASGVVGTSNAYHGVHGTSTIGAGVYGIATSGTGVYGTSTSGWGVAGFSENAGVYGSSSGGYAGFFNGALWGSSLNASAKNFRIDHPLDPANKVLVHSCVESNERLTVYAGTTTTDGNGEATIELPSYFEALNGTVRYQLTVIGAFAQAIVKREVAGGRFAIATSEPRTKVSWQVTGVRQDAYAKAHPLEVEGLKKGREKGRYLAPREHGQPDSAGVAAAMQSANAQVN